MLCFARALCADAYSEPPLHHANRGVQPNKHDQIKKESFKALERELIFDIDLTGTLGGPRS